MGQKKHRYLYSYLIYSISSTFSFNLTLKQSFIFWPDITILVDFFSNNTKVFSIFFFNGIFSLITFCSFVFLGGGGSLCQSYS